MTNSLYVYILNTYKEHGPREIFVTLDPSKLREQVLMWPGLNNIKTAENLDAILATASGPMSRVELSDGWGGLQLHIVALDSTPEYDK